MSLDNSGAVVVGAGTLNLNGSVAQASDSTLTGGTSDTGQFGQLNVSGSTALDGTPTVTLVNGYTPTTGDAFAVLTYGSRTGDSATRPDGFDRSFDDVNGVMSLVAQ